MKKLLLLSILSITTFCISKAQIITTYAGNGAGAFAGDGGQATLASIQGAYHIAFDKAGNLYISDYLNFRVRKVTPAGIITTVAGNGNGGYSGDNGPATSASLYYPAGVVVDSADNLYIGDAGNMVVRKVDKNGIITTVAGNHTGGYNGDNIPGTQAELYKPADLAFDKAGNLYIDDILNNRIRKLSPAGIITTVAGNGGQGYSGDGALAVNAALNNPHGLTLDKDGNIFIADGSNMRIRKVSVSTGIITTVAGTGVSGYSGDGGLATAAQLSGPTGVSFDAAGNLYISDFANSVIRKVTTGGIITTFAGTGARSFGGDGGLATSAQLNLPLGTAFDASGNLYISDRENNRVRKVIIASPPTITSFSPTSGSAGTTVVITGTNFTGATAVSFGGVAAKSFTVTSATKITAKVNTGAAGVVKVTTPGGTAISTALFSFCVAPSVKIAASVTSPICDGIPVTFTATPTNGGTSPAYQWQKNHANVGDNSKTYTDGGLKTGDTVTCILTSNASPCLAVNNVSSNAIVFTVNPNLTPTVSITANPGVAVCKGISVQFSAAVTNGGPAPVYQWMKNGVAAGSNSASYTDVSPVTGDSIDLVVTSNATCLATTTATSNSLKLRVDVPSPVISISASKDTVLCGSANVIFKATVTPSFLWQKNGMPVGNSSNTYSDSTLKTNDNIQCFLVSTASACNNNASNILNSNVLAFRVNPLPPTPSAITGPTKAKAGQTGLVFSVTPLDNVIFFWKLPSGAIITAGQGTNTITVNWGSVGGNVAVTASNSCGSSATITKKVAIAASFATTATETSAAAKSSVTDDNIHLTPNPAGAWATLTFSAKTEDKYVVTIADAQNKVLEVRNGVSLKGVNSIKINTAKYAKGVYFITVTNKENGKKSKQLVVGE